MTSAHTSPPRIGVSACLLGRPVRYDGGHKRAPAVRDVLARVAEIVAVCPEKEAGLGVPREPIELVAGPGGDRALGVTSRRDITAALADHARERVAALAALGLHGYVLKTRSPSCGRGSAAIRDPGGDTRRGHGLFARELVRAMPGLAIAEEEELADPEALRDFALRVAAAAAAAGADASALIAAAEAITDTTR